MDPQDADRARLSTANASPLSHGALRGSEQRQNGSPDQDTSRPRYLRQTSPFPTWFDADSDCMLSNRSGSMLFNRSGSMLFNRSPVQAQARGTGNSETNSRAATPPKPADGDPSFVTDDICNSVLKATFFDQSGRAGHPNGGLGMHLSLFCRRTLPYRWAPQPPHDAKRPITDSRVGSHADHSKRVRE